MADSSSFTTGGNSAAVRSTAALFFRALFFIIISALLILIDQYTKLLAVRELSGSGAFVIIDGVFELRYVENTGAAFGMMTGMRALFLVIAPAVSLIMLYLFVRLPGGARYFPVSACMIGIAAGAMGNFIDRLFHAYVVDFLYFRLIDFPVFNVADIYVTCSAAAVILLALFVYDDNELDSILWHFKGKKTEN